MKKKKNVLLVYESVNDDSESTGCYTPWELLTISKLILRLITFGLSVQYCVGFKKTTGISFDTPNGVFYLFLFSFHCFYIIVTVLRMFMQPLEHWDPNVYLRSLFVFPLFISKGIFKFHLTFLNRPDLIPFISTFFRP
eukprot:UN02322